jgi:hypothetical protein
MEMCADNTGRSEDTARYFVRRRVMPKNDVEDVYSFYNIKITPQVVDNPYYVDPIDYERFKKDILMMSTIADFKPIRDEYFYYVPEKTCEVFEVYERGKMTVFVNGQKYGPFPQIGPRRKTPYRAMQFIRVPNSIYGVGIGTIVKPIQDVFDGILNSRMDNVKLVNNKVFIHVTSKDPILQNTDYIELEPGLILHMAEADALTELQMSDVKQGPVLESQNLMQLTEQTLGTNGYALGAQEKVERSAF